MNCRKIPQGARVIKVESPSGDVERKFGPTLFCPANDEENPIYDTLNGGENIFPLEVENVLRMHEEIAEVSVLGVPDEYWGESVQAAVVLRPDSKLTPEEIRTFCRGKIAGYKIPKKVYVWDELPKNTTGSAGH